MMGIGIEIGGDRQAAEAGQRARKIRQQFGLREPMQGNSGGWRAEPHPPDEGERRRILEAGKRHGRLARERRMKIIDANARR